MLLGRPVQSNRKLPDACFHLIVRSKSESCRLTHRVSNNFMRYLLNQMPIEIPTFVHLYF